MIRMKLPMHDLIKIGRDTKQSINANYFDFVLGVHVSWSQKKRGGGWRIYFNVSLSVGLIRAVYVTALIDIEL